MILNYTFSVFETITNQELLPLVLDVKNGIKLNGVLSFAMSNITISTDDAGVTVVPVTAYSLEIDADYTSREALDGGSNATILKSITITNATYAGVPLYISGNNYGSYTDNAVFQNQIDSILSGTAGKGIGSIHSFAVYKDRSSAGLFPFALDNAISQATYAAGYAEIGDMFEESHIAAGDSASGAGMFYPTPPPGFYERSGVVDSDSIDATADVDDSLELITLTTGNYNSLKLSRGATGVGADGVPVRVKLLSGVLPTGLTVGTTYFVRFKTTPDIELYDTEAHAIDTSGTTGRVNLTDAVGTFSVTQEGIVIDGSFQGHNRNLGNTGGTDDVIVNAVALGPVKNGNRYDSVLIGTSLPSVITKDYLDDGLRGTPRISNETRGKTFFAFYYIKIEDVTPNGETHTVYNIADASDVNVTLPDAFLTIVERTYKRTGAGAGKVLFATTSGQTIDGNVPTTYELQNAVKDIFTVFPNGGNWFIKIYDLIS